jgi:hypothetical protein
MSTRRSGDKGVRKVNVPNLSGMTRTQYQAALTAVGLTFSETSSTTGDSGLDQRIVSQGTAAGTVVNIGTSIAVTYHQYVYPGFSHYGGFGHYGGFYHGFYHGFGHYGGFYHGFYHGFSHYGGFYHGFGFGSNWLESIGSNTGVLTVNGRVPASSLSVGDKLFSVSSAQLPEGFVPLNWEVPDFSVDEIVETEIVSITSSLSDKAYVVNSDVYSPNHYILVKDGSLFRFVLPSQITTDMLVYSYNSSDWTPVLSVEEINYIDMVYSINCEPYDMFFTENALVFDHTPSSNNGEV